MKEEKEKFGVIIARFQTPALTPAHKQLIDIVQKNHPEIIIFLGVAAGQPTKRNPLDFFTRKCMVQEYAPKATILPLKDRGEDTLWSKSIDTQLKEIIGNHTAVLYGGRDSFIPFYKGNFPTHEIDSVDIYNATALRQEAFMKVQASEEFRRGVIYATGNRFTSPYLTVDVAIVKKTIDGKPLVLLAKKPGEEKYRFIGGFVDSKDDSITSAAKREASEETGGGLELSQFKIIGDAKIHDWRYAKDEEKIMTVFFQTEYIFGNAVATDDISSLHWVNPFTLYSNSFISEHRPLWELFRAHNDIETYIGPGSL